MKPSTLTRILTLALASTLVALTLAACSSKSSYGHELLDEASGIRVVAENAKDATAITEAAIEVKDGDAIVISPCLDKGSIHVTITCQDEAKTLVFDDDVDGKVMFTTGALPGIYDVETCGKKGATGWMTIFAQNQDELVAQDEALAEALESAGVDADIADVSK